MKQLKLLPITLAVGGALASASTFAANDAEVQALIDRITTLEKKIETDYVYRQESVELSPNIDVPKEIIFSGYARYGADYQSSDSSRVSSALSLNGNATGRLGNEGYGGEFQFGKVFKAESGAVWDAVLMIDNWSDSDMNLKKMYAGVTNFSESQPSLYIWAGRDFHQRVATGLNDYFWVMHDGQGGGFKNYDLGGAKFNLSFVGQADASSTGDTGRYAFTSKLHDIALGDDAKLNLYFNYGFASEAIDDDLKSYQVASEFFYEGQRLVLRYGDNARDSVFWGEEGQKAFLVSLDGLYQVAPKTAVEYVAAYQTEDVADDDYDRANYNINVRPMYTWDDMNSTWLEFGYNVVDFDNHDSKNTSWKVTLSQNVTFGPGIFDRPMIRFFTTVGNADNEFTGSGNTDLDTVTVGAMFEAWW
ncbi:maltoporin [Vibrio xiamenensis]|uniref:Maltoporin n=1 Tax=Vibrio xiamenensis TaxID=861298 RepID=A0A1G7YZ90_9VIBR|nr:carbohydrate porin [Vibrio xiamenensis]SDH01791.1 maltoporin [Vibrio xiamenensis]